MTTDRCDALVIGGGPAGSTAAALLARAGWNVVVVEHSRFPRAKVCGEYISAATWSLLAKLGVAGDLAPIAGRPVTHVGLFAGRHSISARIGGASPAAGLPAGRAVGRAVLDSALVAAARHAGADVRQPWTFNGCEQTPTGCVASIESRDTPGRIERIESRLVIDAHGAWEAIALPHAPVRGHRPGDLLGFKARFDGSSLPRGLMPLLAFPGGYGGMVETDGGQTSLSLCIRRDALARCRARHPGLPAGEAVVAHLRASCEGVDRALSGARIAGRWLAAGPLATGIRTFGSGRAFAVGNAAAEAHPVIAEGVSMAIQSSALLAGMLVDAAPHVDPDRIRAAYERAWRAHFAFRLRCAALFAHGFMRPVPTSIATAAVRLLPSLLTIGASFSGKSSALPVGVANPSTAQGLR